LKLYGTMEIILLRRLVFLMLNLGSINNFDNSSQGRAVPSRGRVMPTHGRVVPTRGIVVPTRGRVVPTRGIFEYSIPNGGGSGIKSISFYL